MTLWIYLSRNCKFLIIISSAFTKALRFSAPFRDLFFAGINLLFKKKKKNSKDKRPEITEIECWVGKFCCQAGNPINLAQSLALQDEVEGEETVEFLVNEDCRLCSYYKCKCKRVLLTYWLGKYYLTGGSQLCTWWSVCFEIMAYLAAFFAFWHTLIIVPGRSPPTIGRLIGQMGHVTTIKTY